MVDAENQPPEHAHSSWRIALLLIGVVCFFLQTGFVYWDYPRQGPAQELSKAASEGLALWRENNCQACHQIYGYGGFLGPDLTNIMRRRPHDDWTHILTMGRKQMPAFDFTEQERAAIITLLTEINETGNGLPHLTQLREGVGFATLVQAYAESEGRSVDEAVLRGEEHIGQSGCTTCHTPFDVGLQGAPDLTKALSRRTPEYVETILHDGKRAMLPFPFLRADQVQDIIAYLKWIRDNRRDLGRFYSLKERGDTVRWSDLPWFEY